MSVDFFDVDQTILSGSSGADFILAGVRLGIGRGVVGMAIAEVYLRLSGLGTLIATYGASFQVDYLIAAILPLPFLGVVLTKALGLLEARFQVWKV